MYFDVIFELVLAGFCIYGLFNEEKLIEFEDRVKQKIEFVIESKKKMPEKTTNESAANVAHPL